MRALQTESIDLRRGYHDPEPTTRPRARSRPVGSTSGASDSARMRVGRRHLRLPSCTSRSRRATRRGSHLGRSDRSPAERSRAASRLPAACSIVASCSHGSADHGSIDGRRARDAAAASSRRPAASASSLASSRFAGRGEDACRPRRRAPRTRRRRSRTTGAGTRTAGRRARRHGPPTAGARAPRSCRAPPRRADRQRDRRHVPGPVDQDADQARRDQAEGGTGRGAVRAARARDPGGRDCREEDDECRQADDAELGEQLERLASARSGPASRGCRGGSSRGR